MSKLDKDTVIDNFTQAYTQVNGKAPTIEAKGGWYSVDGGKNVRLAQIEEMTAELGAGAKPETPAKAVAKPKADNAKPAKKEVAAKAAPAKKAVAKKKPAKKVNKSSFSVKDFYTQQIMDANPGAKAPR